MRKSDFVFRLETAKSLVNSEQLFIDNRVGDTPHNIRARFLRNGLIVQMYASLESNLKLRFEEFCRDLSQVGIPYGDFGDDLKSYFTFKAVYGLTGLIRRTDKSTRLATSEAQIGNLGLHLITPPTYSPLGFGYENSNIYADDIAAAIKAVGYKEPWKLMDAICASVGLTTTSTKVDISNFLERRNRAAHNASVSFGPTDIEQSARAAFQAAFCFDTLFTHFLRLLRRTGNLAQTVAALPTAAIQYRFLDEESSGAWKERVSTNGRPFRSFSNEADAKREAFLRASTKQQVLVLRDARGQPRDWMT